MYLVLGKVKKGQQRGKSLGFPTANIALLQKIPSGIYISETTFKGNVYPSISYIGSPRILETYILDFDGNLYGQQISVHLRKRLRNSKIFNNTSDLVAAIKEDESLARQSFRKA